MTQSLIRGKVAPEEMEKTRSPPNVANSFYHTSTRGNASTGTNESS